MRKSSLVKAMACFMATTMAVTCVPGVNVTNGVAVVTEAAETVTVPEPIGKFEFGENKLKNTAKNATDSATLTGVHSQESATKTEAEYTNDGYLKLDGSYGVKLPKSAIPTSKKFTISYTTTLTENPSQFSAQIFLVSDTNQPPSNWMSLGKAGVNADGIYGIWSGSAGKDNMQVLPEKSDVQFVNDRHNFTVVVNEKDATIYCDGVKLTNNSEFNVFQYEHNPEIAELYLGVNAWDPAVNAVIEKVEVYNEALNEEQVLEITPTTACKELAFADGVATTSSTNPRLAVRGKDFEFNIKLTGEDITKTIRDTVSGAAITLKAADSIEKAATAEAAKNILADNSIFTTSAAVTVKKVSNDTATVTVTPAASATSGAIEINCGGAKPLVYYFNAVSNYCVDLRSSRGNAKVNGVVSFTSTADERTSFVVTAVGKDNEAEMDREIRAMSGKDFVVGGIKFEKTTGIAIPNGVPKTDIVNNESIKSQTYYVDVQEGQNIFLFECDGQPLVVEIIGIKKDSLPSAPGTVIPGTDTPGTATPGTDTPGADTPGTTTPEAVTPGTDTPGADTPGTDTPGTDTPGTTTPGTTDTDSNDTDSKDNTEKTASKKKAKVASVAAKKGKKIISGVVKLSSGKKVSKATVKVYVNNKKKATVKTKSSGKFSVKLSKKLKKGDKVKLVITKSNIKKITKTVKVK